MRTMLIEKAYSRLKMTAALGTSDLSMRFRSMPPKAYLNMVSMLCPMLLKCCMGPIVQEHKKPHARQKNKNMQRC